MAASAHHHGYTWIGSGLEMLKDGPRRSVHPEFRSSRVPPLENADWLKKPASFVQGTWDDLKEAAHWFGEQAKEHAPEFSSAHAREVLADTIASAAEMVAGGQDAIGGWWLTGQRFLSVCLIGCSLHRFRPEYPCPKP
ncbi:hypothetical protein ABZ746_15040 [Streptomyces sp. NPDC020096]